MFQTWCSGVAEQSQCEVLHATGRMDSYQCCVCVFLFVFVTVTV